MAEDGCSCLPANLLRSSPGCRVSDRWGTGSLEDRAANSPGEQLAAASTSRPLLITAGMGLTWSQAD